MNPDGEPISVRRTALTLAVLGLAFWLVVGLVRQFRAPERPEALGRPVESATACADLPDAEDVIARLDRSRSALEAIRSIDGAGEVDVTVDLTRCPGRAELVVRRAGSLRDIDIRRILGASELAGVPVVWSDAP
ncbi:MAG: hypothetical protein OEY23_09120 [Acidimicrobiia bacterium]|nr:hypothetical protein [Acidimicrobiia bacterium]